VELSSLDLHFLTNELQTLIGARVDKLYCPQRKEVLLQLFLSGQGKKLLRITAPNLIYMTDYKQDQPEKPSGFCTLIRKYLGGARLRSIRMLGFERIVELCFEKEEVFYLVAELFSKGNIILLNSDKNIIAATENQIWKDRQIKPKLQYDYPKKDVNFLELKKEDLKNVLTKSKKQLVKALAIDVGMGGHYAEELCFLSSVLKGKEVTDSDDISKLYLAREKLLKQNIEPSVYSDNGLIKTVSALQLNSMGNIERKIYPSLNEALADVATKVLVEQENLKKLSKQQIKIDKLKNIVKKQEEYITELEEDMSKDSRKAELIYENYTLVNSIIKDISKAREKLSLKEIKDKLKGHKMVKEINEKDKIITIDLADK
jgi:predicted ribosome quality control (RQC) complex YloA/Tae2 family protein